MALRDECTDSSKTGEGRRSRESYTYEIDTYADTLADQKRKYPDSLNATR